MEKKYVFLVTETAIKTVIVYAENSSDAFEIAQEEDMMKDLDSCEWVADLIEGEWD